MTLPVTSPELESLVPHRPPMRWIDVLVECTETEAKGRVTFLKDHFAVVNGKVEQSALVECVAQTVAAALGYRSCKKASAAKSSNGMLAAVSNFAIEKPAPLDVPVEINVKEVKRLGPMLLISATLVCDGDLLAAGELSLYA